MGRFWKAALVEVWYGSGTGEMGDECLFEGARVCLTDQAATGTGQSQVEERLDEGRRIAFHLLDDGIDGPRQIPMKGGVIDPPPFPSKAHIEPLSTVGEDPSETSAYPRHRSHAR